MNYWWVNHNQTARHEIGGRYMWSPKKNKGGRRYHFYETMKEVAPGDVVFSFANKVIGHIGIAISYSFDATRPNEFGNTGNQWDAEGWKVAVDDYPLSSPLKPSVHMRALAPTLPAKYSPIKQNGIGNQVYLAGVPQAMASTLLRLIGPKAQSIIDQAVLTIISVVDPSVSLETEAATEREIEKKIADDPSLKPTEKWALISAGRGQGLFRTRVEEIESHCHVTGVTNPQYRIASRIKPWSKSSNHERLDGQNGLLLTPHIDYLFDKGFISFNGDGMLLISPAADGEALAQMGIPLNGKFNAGSFTKRRQSYLEYHRTEIFRKAVI